MATPRVELIMQAVVTKLTGLTTTGSRIYRGKVYACQNGEMPGIAVYLGDDRVVTELQTGKIDWELTVFIEAYAKSSSTQIETIVNGIRGEVHAALMTAPTHGLAYVIDTTPGDALQPQLSDKGNQPIAMLRMEYIIKYRTSRNALDG